jgi:hypothetical protein
MPVKRRYEEAASGPGVLSLRSVIAAPPIPVLGIDDDTRE